MYSILYVEKRSPHRERIFKELQETLENIKVEFFENGDRALKRLKTRQFDCIIFDQSSPGSEGLRFLRKLRKAGDATPFILIADDGEIPRASEFLDLSIDDCLPRNYEKVLPLRLASSIQRAVLLNTRRMELKAAEEKLKCREKQYEPVFTQAPDGVVMVDAKGIITDCNECEAGILGYAKSEIIGKHISDFHTKQSAGILKSKLKLLRNEGTVSADLDLKRKDGQVIRVWRMGSAVYGLKKNFKGAMFTTRETTDRKQFEDSLKESGELLASILECSLDGTVVFRSKRDESGIIVDFEFVLVNPEAERIMCRKQNKLLGVGLLEFAPENRENGLFDMFVEVVERGKPLEKDHHFQNGEIEGWFQIRAAKLADGCAVTFSDITQLKETENALMNERNMFIGGPVVVFRTRPNPSEPPLYVSQNIIQFGYSAEDAMSGKIGIKDLIHPDDYRRVIKTILNNARHNRDTFDVEFRVLKPDGEIRWVSEFLVIMRDENDTFTNYQGYVLDITERVKAEQSLQRMLDELEKRVEERTIKLIRTNEFLLKEISERKQVEYKLRSYQEKLRSLASELTLTGEKERRRLAIALHDRIGQSLALSKIKLTTLLQEIESKGLEDRLREITSVVNQTIQDTRSLTFEISPPDLYELGFVAAAESLVERYGQEYGIKAEFVSNEGTLPLSEEVAIILYQVLRELIINIIKHSNADKMRITLRKAGNFVRVRVWDNGKGFEPSAVLQDSSSLSFGLFSIQERLEPLGGNMDISSKIGVGTEITLKVPLKSAGEYDHDEDKSVVG